MRLPRPFLCHSRPLPLRTPPSLFNRISFIHFQPTTAKMANNTQYGGDPLPDVGATYPSQNNQSKSGEDDWTKRPPYSIRSPEEFGPVKWRGKCQCGQVTYQLSRDRPLKSKFCHCRGCQVTHGMSAVLVVASYLRGSG